MRKIRVLAFLMILGVGLSLPLSIIRVKAEVDIHSEPVVSFSVNGKSSWEKFSAVVDNVNSEVNKVCATFNKKNSSKKGFLYLSDYDNKTVTIYMRQSVYRDQKQSVKTEIMNAALNVISNTGNDTLQQRNRNKLYNFIAGMDEGTSALLREIKDDTKADFFTASYYLRPFKGGLSTVLGVIALLLFAFLALTSIIDVSYIALPFVQNALEPKNDSKNGGLKAKFVSKEAVNAVIEANKNPGHTALGYYIRSKFGQYIALGICLLYLCSGMIFDLVANLVDYFQGVVD